MSKNKLMNKTKIKIVKNTKIENMNNKKIWIIFFFIFLEILHTNIPSVEENWVQDPVSYLQQLSGSSLWCEHNTGF